MLPLELNNNFCEECNKQTTIEDLYVIYKVIVVSYEQYFSIRINELLDELNDFVLQEGYYLSSSQIILLRPDILKIFLNQKYYPIEVLFWFLCENEICNDCFSKYKLLIPER